MPIISFQTRPLDRGICNIQNNTNLSSNREIKQTSPSVVGNLFVVLDSSLQSRRIHTHNLSNLLSILEKQESRHGANAEFLRNVGALVDVKLDKVDIGVFLAPGVDFGGNGFAGAAPFGEGVDDDEFVGVVDGGVEFRLAVDIISIFSQ
jgi:hypothetical protein